nr:RagB/SusD family nutrient uptake outer membrane protein [Paraflavitalea speifideiaquila]
MAWGGQWFNGGKTFLAYYKASADGTSYVKGRLVDDTNAGDNTGSAVECAKFIARVDNNNDGHFAWPVFRLAECYLAYAEALNEYSGPTAEAFQYLNLIRQRAGMPNKDASMLADQVSFRTAIQNERTIELAFEDHRYNDLHRWLTAHVVLNKPFNGFAVTASTNGVTPNLPTPSSIGTWLVMVPEHSRLNITMCPSLIQRSVCGIWVERIGMAKIPDGNNCLFERLT